MSLATETAEIYNRNVDMVYRICFMYTKSKHDAEDMTQNVFIRLMKCGMQFETPEHEKAWLIRTASNLCKDLFKSAWYTKILPLKEQESSVQEESLDKTDLTLAKVLALPKKYKTAIYLHYYEGYKAAEIAKTLKKPESTIRGYLMRGRKLLKAEIERENEKENDYGYKTSY